MQVRLAWPAARGHRPLKFSTSRRVRSDRSRVKRQMQACIPCDGTNRVAWGWRPPYPSGAALVVLCNSLSCTSRHSDHTATSWSHHSAWRADAGDGAVRASLAAPGLPLNLGRSLAAAYPPTAEAASYAPAKEKVAAAFAPVKEAVTGTRARPPLQTIPSSQHSPDTLSAFRRLDAGQPSRTALLHAWPAFVATAAE